MARDALNFFEPYEALPPQHENQLTRALVVVLKLSPMAHASWLRRVDPELALHSLPAVDWRVQRRDIVPAGGADPERMRVISVLLSGERSDTGGEIVASARGQVLDAIALYGRELAVVVENKVTGEPNDHQARALNVGGHTLALDAAPRRLRWRDVLADLADLVSRDLVSGAEAGVIEDFLEYAEAYFERLLPFSNLRVCRGSSYRVQRRLRSLLSDATGIEARQDRRPSVSLPGARSIDRVYLELDGTTVNLNVWPADTLAQARALYSRPDGLAALCRLRDAGWRLWPNFHFGHMTKGLAWTPTPIAVEDYIDFWTREIGNARQVKRPAWDSYWDWLVTNGIVRPDGRAAFRRDFDDTQRQDATPRPGLRLQRAWSLADAESLDDVRGRFGASVRAAVVEVLAALGEPTSLGLET